MFLAHRDELDAHALAGSDVPDYCRAADFAFGHRKQQGDGSADRRRRKGIDEKTANIQIPDAGYVLRSVVLPGDPDTFRSRDARVATIVLRRIDQRG